MGFQNISKVCDIGKDTPPIRKGKVYHNAPKFNSAWVRFSFVTKLTLNACLQKVLSPGSAQSCTHN